LLGVRLFLRKLDSYGKCVKFKVHVIAKEFSQIPIEDFGEIFSSVTKFSILCVFLALTAHLGFEICQVNVIAIYLQGNLNKDIYIEVPDCHGILEPFYFSDNKRHMNMVTVMCHTMKYHMSRT